MTDTFKFQGTLRTGEETPNFDAVLFTPRKEWVAVVSSDGKGGSASIRWNNEIAWPLSVIRKAAEAWLTAEATRIWESDPTLGPVPGLLRYPDEAAIVVAPAHLSR